MATFQAPNEKPSAIWFDNISHSYGPDLDILSNVDFEAPAGSFTLLTGPSGAGKTTLLKLAYLAMSPNAGRICLFGVDSGRLNRAGLANLRRRIGVVFQEFRLLDHLNAYDNVALPLRVAGQNETAYRDDVVELLNWVGLGDRMEAKPETLSGGEKQRVAIARAIVAKPDLLIADEPTGNVDPEMGQRLLRLFQELNRRLGTTVLIATHDQDMMRDAGATIMRIADGSVMRHRPSARRPYYADPNPSYNDE